jgi:hypothetical protein
MNGETGGWREDAWMGREEGREGGREGRREGGREE